MGLYAQTDLEIEVNTKKAFDEVLKIVESMKLDKELENIQSDEMEGDTWYIYGFMSSGRVQNLQWRCEQIWDAIKHIDGVVEFRAPFMVGDGVFFEK